MISLTNRFFSIFLLTLYILGCLFLLSYCETPADSSALLSTSARVPVYTYKTVNTYPHDSEAFTQGLFFEGGVLYESTGRFGHSSLRRTELETGEILQQHRLPSRFFGEGTAVCGDRIIQLTWRSNVGFVYDRDSFDLLRTFRYPGEGWGITYNGDQLIMSDGTSALHFMDPENFRRTGHIRVYDGDAPVTRLNELEYIAGEIYANVWETDRIARIDPRTGRVTGWIELEGLLSLEDRMRGADVLNGIAYDRNKDRLFVTGKLWPKLFEIKLIPRVGKGVLK